MAAPLLIQEAFESAKKDFFCNLKEPSHYDFSKFTSINDVYNTTDRIQEEQSRTGNMRHLNKIRPYLDGLSQYITVIDTFVQAKAEILSLIWGPIKLLLQISSTLIESYDKILNAMAQIGGRLPQFQMYSELFHSNDRIKHVLCIFFRDILDFHATALNFFKLKKWKLFFESLWPKYGTKISVILDNIDRHIVLMNSEVTLAHITEAYTARTRAFEESERTEEFRRRQDFELTKLSLSPRLYDEDLERFQRDCCAGSGEWLKREQLFCNWLNPTDQSTRLFWLEGIPGAGKTFLSSTIIREAQMHAGFTMFAFLSYRESYKMTTIKILHSFIFQLVLENRALQPILNSKFQSQYRQLSSSVPFTRDLLSDLLKCVDSSYIIMDGIDEIEEAERRFLLQAVLKIYRDCENVKVLISSRAEDDISKILRKEAQSARIDSKNLGDIQSYLIHRADTWLSENEFDIETSVEIKRLLIPVALKAKGMFLYARLIMDNVTSLSNLQDIREEITVLPEGLDEAYARILIRIDKRLKPKEREEAKRILGWVGCSSIPMRKQEIEYALAIRPEDRSFPKDRKVFRNMMRLCGPVIEVQDDFVQFVHFTAKEYLFSQQSDRFLKSMDAHLDLSSVCMKYLAFECFDVELSDKLERSIVSGDCILQNYAASQWLKHIEVCAGEMLRSGNFDDFSRKVKEFTQIRENLAYRAPREEQNQVAAEFKVFKKNWPEVYELLSRASFFWQFKAREASLTDSETLFDEDPLTVFSTYARIYRQLDSMLCPTEKHRDMCHCNTLRSHYGSRLFKCDRLSCKYHRIGFETRSERERHLRAHSRPFKCPDSSCDFAVIGYRSNSELLQHTERCHKDRTLHLVQLSSVNDIQQDDLVALLIHAVKGNEVEYVRHLLCDTPNSLDQTPYAAAVRYSSAAMVELFIEHGADINWIPTGNDSEQGLVPLIVAVTEGNFEVTKLLLERGCDIHKKNSGSQNSEYDQGMRALDYAMSTLASGNAATMISLLLAYGADPSLRRKHLACLIPMEKDPQKDLEVIRCLELLKSEAFKKDGFNNVLKIVAERNCSIEIAKYLLQNGAKIDSRGIANSITSATPLYKAAQKTTAEAAEFMKFLLQSGANPDLQVGGRKVGDMRGAQNISKWLGMTWDELVKSTANSRASS